MRKGCILLLLIGLMSCQKAPLDRKFEGFWKLKSIQIDNNEVYPDSLYMSFQLNVVQLRKVTPNDYSPVGEMGYYLRHQDSLFIEMQTTTEFVQNFGFRSINERFLIEQFTHKELVLRNNYGVWIFKKY